MKLAEQARPLLEENGIVITLTGLTASGQTYKWSDLVSARLVRDGNVFKKLFSRQTLTVQLMISTKGNPMPSRIFETRDAALVLRIEQAINQVAQRRRATRWSKGM